MPHFNVLSKKLSAILLGNSRLNYTFFVEKPIFGTQKHLSQTGTFQALESIN